MMGHREKLKGGLEWDALTGWRKVHSFRAGERKQAKNQVHRRSRKEAKQELARWKVVSREYKERVMEWIRIRTAA